MMLESLRGVSTVGAAVGVNTTANVIPESTVRPDSCANRTYVPAHAGFFPHGYTGKIAVDVSLASGQKSVQCKIGTAVIPIIADDGHIIDLELPDALESDCFNHTLVSQRQLYNLYGTQQIDNPDDTMTILFPNGDTTTLDVVNGVYHYRLNSAQRHFLVVLQMRHLGPRQYLNIIIMPWGIFIRSNPLGI